MVELVSVRKFVVCFRARMTMDLRSSGVWKNLTSGILMDVNFRGQSFEDLVEAKSKTSPQKSGFEV
jgi:hypothetical protein